MKRLYRLAKRVWDSAAFRVALVASNLLLLLLFKWDLRPYGGPFDPVRAGDVASWFTGLLTLGAVALAALALRADRERFEQDRGARERERQEEASRLASNAQLESRQAAGQFYAWLSPRKDAFERLVGVECHFENRTPLPIYSWEVMVDGADLRLSNLQIGPIVPGHTAILRTDKLWQALVQEGLVAQQVAVAFDASNGERLGRQPGGALEVLSFRPD